MKRSKLRYDEMLGEVGVLIFVDKDISEKLLVMASDVGEIPEEDIHVDEDIVEVHRVSTSASFTVCLEYLARQRTLRLFVGIVVVGVLQLSLIHN